MFAFTLKPDIEQLHRVRPVGAPARPRLARPGVHASPRTARTSPRSAIVVRNGFSHDLADLLVADLQRHTAYFDKLTAPLPDAGGKSFSH